MYIDRYETKNMLGPLRDQSFFAPDAFGIQTVRFGSNINKSVYSLQASWNRELLYFFRRLSKLKSCKEVILQMNNYILEVV